MYRCAYVMFRALELRALELTPCFHSDAVPQYFEQTIRDAHLVFASKTVTAYLHRPALVPSLYFHLPEGIPIVLPTVGSCSLLDRQSVSEQTCARVWSRVLSSVSVFHSSSSE